MAGVKRLADAYLAIGDSGYLGAKKKTILAALGAEMGEVIGPAATAEC